MSTELEIREENGSERRRFQRRKVFSRQLVTVELGDGRAAILIDVSEDGIAVQPIRPLKLGAKLRLEFGLPRNGGMVEGQGEVVWLGHGGRAGIRFSHLTQRSWCNLDRWLRVVEDPLAEAIRNYTQRQTAENRNGLSPAGEGCGIQSVEERSTGGEQNDAEEPERLDLETVLNLVTERACTATSADGAALVIESAGEFVCCSTVGDAPEIGVLVKPQSLTGESLRHGVSLLCNDICADARANASGEPYAAAIIVVPVLSKSHIVGGIVALSSKKDAFTERDGGRLKRLAEIASKLADELRGSE